MAAFSVFWLDAWDLDQVWEMLGRRVDLGKVPTFEVTVNYTQLLQELSWLWLGFAHIH